MSSKIFEEEGRAPVAGGMATAQQKIEKQARQLAYDTRYQVKKEIGEKKVNPAAMKRLLLQRLQKSTAAPNVKVRAKQMLLGEDYIGDVADFASGTVANALFKVFVEGVEEVSGDIQLEYLKELDENPNKKYKVRVTDEKTGNSYVRYATREKITQLRTNPNIKSVEMTEYGEPREGERKSGEDTARATGGGKAKKDYDGDGKVESGAKEHAGAVHNAIQRKKGLPADGKDTTGIKEELVGGQKKIDVAAPYGKLTGADFKKLRKAKKKGVAEEFLSDAASVEQNTTKITGKNVDNYAGKNPAVTIMPEDQTSERTNTGTAPRSVYAHYESDGEFISEKAVSKAQQKFMGMVYAVKQGAKPMSKEVSQAAAGMSKKEARKFAKTKHEGLPTHKEEAECSCEDEPKLKKNKDVLGDVRELPTKVNLVKNKLRVMGLKMSYEPEGEVLDERRREDKGKPRPPRDRAMEIVRKMPNYRVGGMTGSGKTIAQHEAERGVKKQPGAPTQQGETTADRLSQRKARKAGAEAIAQRHREEEQRRRRLS